MAVMKMGMYMSGKGARYIVVSIESRRWNTLYYKFALSKKMSLMVNRLSRSCTTRVWRSMARETALGWGWVHVFKLHLFILRLTSVLQHISSSIVF